MTPDSDLILTRSAIDPDQAAALGVREATTVEDLPEFARRHGDDILPALVFPWRSIDGELVEQVRPARPVLNGDGRPSKYLWPAGVKPVLNVLERVTDPKRVLIVEGTRQGLAALRYAPAKWQIVGIGGCSSWTVDGVGNPDLAELVDGRPVTIIFDADVGKNIEVWTAAKTLGEACELFGASDVSWGTVPGRGETGLDDVLGSLPEARRTKLLKKIVAQASRRLPPKPKASRSAERIDWIALRSGGRPVLNVDDDRLAIGTTVAGLMRDRWDGTRLFMFGDRLTAIESGVPLAVNEETFVHLANQAADPRSLNAFTGSLDPAEFSTTTLRISRDICNRSFKHLAGVTRAPFVRDDGTVCTSEGYDEASGLLLIPSPGLEAVTVPETPTLEDVTAALNLIFDEWLEGFPFESDADRANALGLVVTPFIRDRVTLVPLAVLDGRGAGVGKGLFGEVLSLLATGEVSHPVSVPMTRDEGWKTLHSYAAQGHELLMLDEAHVLEGAALAQALTAPVISSRTLGKSEVNAYPNRMTWLAAGNHVTVRGDLFRRVYRIHLYPEREGWENRRASDFKHPNLRLWTIENRAELLSAVLTLVRYWYVLDCPSPQEQSVGFGSFEEWQETVGGILEAAGVKGFLDNLMSWRAEAAEDRTAWAAHLADVHADRGETPYTIEELRLAVIAERVTDPMGEVEGSPDPSKDRRGYNFAVGNLCKKWRDQPVGGFVLRQDDTGAHRKVAKWRVIELPGGTGGTGGTATSRTYESASVQEHAHAHKAGPDSVLPVPPSLPVDFETPSASELATGRHEGPFLRVLAYGDRTTSDPEVMRDVLTSAERLEVSGGIRFDLPAAAIHLGLDAYELALKADDTEVLGRLVDPPRAKTDRYGLSELAGKYLGEDKDDALPRLKRKYGGYDRIPVDDPEYLAYAIKDTELTRRVLEALEAPDPAYAARERRVGALAASLTARGVRVDVDLLSERIHDRQSAALQRMAVLETFGFPPADSATSVPWRHKEAGPVFDALLPEDESWPRGANDTPKTDRETLEYVAGVADGDLLTVVTTILEITRAGSSFAQQTSSALSPAGRVHPQHRITSTTGRWSTSDPNVLGVGKRGDHLLAERDIILAEPGEVFIAIDLAGIDARAVAGLSGDPAYAELMAPGTDIHLEIAEVFFGERTPEARKAIKPYTHGIPYGRQAKALAKSIVKDPGRFHGLDWTEVEPQMVEYLRRYYERFPLILKWQDTVRGLTAGGGVIDNGFGRGVRVEPGWEFTQAASRQAQSCARDLAMEGLFRIHDAGLWPMVRMFVHDEVVLSVPADRALEIGRQVAELMSFEWSSPSGLVIPVLAQFDALYGPRWSDAYKEA